MKTLLSQSAPISECSTVLGSQFIALLSYTPNTDSFAEFLKSVREDHPKATHHCQAYRINTESTQEFASDDGEPSGTAGLPMLNVLKKHELVNVGAVVVRYFGGTKLGKKGLIDAYREVVEQAVHSTEIKLLEKKTRFRIQYPYSASNEIQRLLHLSKAQTKKETFAETVEVEVHISEEIVHSFQEKINSFKHIGIKHKNMGLIFV